VVLVRPHAAGEPDAGLHLVEDEQRAVLVGEVAQRAQELDPEVVVTTSAWMGSIRTHAMSSLRVRNAALTCSSVAASAC